MAGAKCTVVEATKAAGGETSGIPAECMGCLGPCATMIYAEQMPCVSACTVAAAPPAAAPAATGTSSAGPLPLLHAHLAMLLAEGRWIGKARACIGRGKG